jgi:dTDP-4-dehydrorhamnose 3,5-epimerase
MRYHRTAIDGVVVVEPEPHADERGLFARTWDPAEAADHVGDVRVAQCSTSFNRRASTLRGLHWQAHPHGEAKLVRCTSGAIYDVAVDLRPTSPTFLGWTARELTAANREALYIPAGCAHGFLTLADDTEVFYQISVPYVAAAARGARWDDPALGIDWPAEPQWMSEKDAGWPGLGLGELVDPL